MRPVASFLAAGWLIVNALPIFAAESSNQAPHPLPEMLGPGPAATGGTLPPVPGEVLVKLRRGSPTAVEFADATRRRQGSLQSTAQAGSLGAILGKHGLRDVRPAFRVAATGKAVQPMAAAAGSSGKTRQDLFRWYTVQVATHADLAAVVAELRQHEDVETAEPNGVLRLAQGIDPPISGLPDVINDPGFDEQWHHEYARIPQAWNYLKESGRHPGGSRDVVVAVIDSGVDATHEDLVANMWTNSGEIPGNNLDDDDNGFVDDIHGCSVVSDSRSHSGDSSDQYGHGTHVAGIIAATAGNGRGGVGVAFNVQIMSIRAAQYVGLLTFLDITEAVLYAIDHGAEVINMSFGGYGRSQILEDALEVALNQAMLIAAAGNNSGPQMYPASLHYVIGVAACSPKGKRAWFSNNGDMIAPGVSVYSTLPGNEYAAWSGTSMAAPVIAGIGALMRSYYWQPDLYSTRFLMGGLFASGGDAYLALTVLPVPGVTVLENWLFDEAGIHARNDDDGRVDSGETVHLGIELINRSGRADNVFALLRARAPGATMDDPYVRIDVPLIEFGSIGPWNTADNGFIYSDEGIITGVRHPFVFSVAPDCPNEHIIPFEMLVVFQDGWDPDHPYFETHSRFQYIVQRGKNLPTVISSNLTLTADEYWMVGGPVLVEPGAALTIEPGTQVQWGAVSDDPYNPGPQSGSLIVRGALAAHGTLAAPINLFPSYLVSGQKTKITVDAGGVANLSYVKVRNPELRNLGGVDHAYFEWDAYDSTVTAQRVSRSLFHKFRGGGSIEATAGFDTCLFDAGWIVPPAATLENCTFLQDNENNRQLWFSPPGSYQEGLARYDGWLDYFYSPVTLNGETLVAFPTRGRWRLAQAVASHYGGQVAAVRSESDWTAIRGWLANVPLLGETTWFLLGMRNTSEPGRFTWPDGSPVTYGAWRPGQPDVPFLTEDSDVVVGVNVKQGAFTPGWFIDNTYWARAGITETYILRLPGTWTMAGLVAPLESGAVFEHVKGHFPSAWRFNAFLNRYYDPNLGRWMRFSPSGGRDTCCDLRETFWGTDTRALIDYAIIDYYDDFTSGKIHYGTPPAHGFASTYPFAEDVLVNGQSLLTVPKVEAGPATFRVVFNRDMDTNVEPFVSFGPSPPHTDFQIRPRGENFLEVTNGWLGSRTWEGQAWITPITGNGYHLMRVSGAVAADDPWLVSGHDVARLRFKVETVGVASMTLQADGREGGILLNWQQNDYDLLAGYNLYRAVTPDGPYTRLNATVIPPGSEQYLDTAVTPAVPMYYRFTILSTGFEESEASNVASAAAHDTIPPVLNHTPVTLATPGRQLRLTAGATDNVGVSGVMVHHRPRGSGGEYTALPMVRVSGDDWSATLPASVVQPPGVEYYVVARDGISPVYSGTPALPHVVIVSDVPTVASVTPQRGPAHGGTAVTVAGLQFQTGASVLFGGILASNIVVLGPNQITCVTPPHFPALVEVQVVNTNGTQTTLLNGFRYEAAEAVLALPVMSGDFGGAVEVPLSAANMAGLRAADVTVLFDPAVLTVQDTRLGTLTAGWSLSANPATPGRLRLSLASATAVSGSGTLAVLVFQVIAPPPASSTLALAEVRLNDGAIAVETSSGTLDVNGFWSLSGTVRYFEASRPVGGTVLAWVGSGARTTTTGEDGGFALTQLPTGSGTLTPEKSDEATGITGYDAALVLQAANGLRSLSAAQSLAADVNRNGVVSSMDAAYILEQAVGLIAVPFPNAGRVWDFVPVARTYPRLNADLAGEDFTAVLIGDVSGNWPGEGLQLRGDPPPEEPPVVLAFDTGMARPDPDAVRILFRSQAGTPAVHSVDLVLSFDPVLAAVVDVRKGSSTAQWLLASNTQQPGRVRVAAASAAPLAPEGELVTLVFDRQPLPPLAVHSLAINEGAVPAEWTTAETLDADRDGLVDFDETATYQTDRLRPDTDGDGCPDGEEVRAGTDPRDPGSWLGFTTTAIKYEAGLRLVWSSTPGRRYAVQYTERLEPGAATRWTPLGPAVTATGRETVLVDDAWGATAPPPARFYRVRLVEE